MVRIICISGKDGSGKTTVAINIALALQKMRKKTILIDLNFANANVGLYFGINPTKTLNDFLRDKISINDALFKHTSGLGIIFSSMLVDMGGANYDKLKIALKTNFKSMDFVILDSSGFGDDFVAAMKASDDILFVSTPQVDSLVEVEKYIQLLKGSDERPKIIGMVLNLVKKKKYEFTRKEIAEFAEVPIIGTLLESDDVAESSNRRKPIVLQKPDSQTAKAFDGIAAKICATRSFTV
jgi:MinD-like ATPase involved in chromosome partitioning or flagellar assembly